MKGSEGSTHICNRLEIVLDARFRQLPFLLGLAFDQTILGLFYLFLRPQLMR